MRLSSCQITLLVVGTLLNLFNCTVAPLNVDKLKHPISYSRSLELVEPGSASLSCFEQVDKGLAWVDALTAGILFIGIAAAVAISKIVHCFRQGNNHTTPASAAAIRAAAQRFPKLVAGAQLIYA